MTLNRGTILPTWEMNGINKILDYSGCFYPRNLDPNNVFYFNEENIDEVVFERFKDEDEERFQKVYTDS